MNPSFSVADLWPHFLLVALLGLVSLRVRSRVVLLVFALALSVVAAWAYWQLGNGIAPPRVSARTGQLIALQIACLVPLLAIVFAAEALRKRGLQAAPRMAIAVLVGLLVVVCMPGLQMFFGCSFTGACP